MKLKPAYKFTFYEFNKRQIETIYKGNEFLALLAYLEGHPYAEFESMIKVQSLPTEPTPEINNGQAAEWLDRPKSRQAKINFALPYQDPQPSRARSPALFSRIAIAANLDIKITEDSQ